MENNIKRKIFFGFFCLASIVQGMYSTYFVSVLTTIERVYHLQSKTAGAIMSASEIGQIIGALFIAHHGGRGDKPKWIAACMIVSALAGLTSTSPHFLLKRSDNVNPLGSLISSHQPPTISTIKSLTMTGLAFESNSSSSPLDSHQQPLLVPRNSLCYLDGPHPFSINSTTISSELISIEQTYDDLPIRLVLVIFFVCLLAIGFGSTAITTLGIPLVDEIVSREDTPFYLGLTIGLKIFGPALGFLLGSFCISLNTILLGPSSTIINETMRNESFNPVLSHHLTKFGAWWLGPIIISVPLILLAIPLYYLSRTTYPSKPVDDFEAITYQAAEDHDLGDSRDFQTHVLTIGDLDVMSNRTHYSDLIDSSSREVLQSKFTSPKLHYNFGQNIALEKPVLGKHNLLDKSKDDSISLQIAPSDNRWTNKSCVVIKQFSGLKPTTFLTNEDIRQDNDDEELNDSRLSKDHAYESSKIDFNALSPSCSSSLISQNKQTSFATKATTTSTTSSTAKTTTTTSTKTAINLSSSISRLLENKLLILRLLSTVLHLLPIAGFYTFLPKFLNEQFRVANSSASAISGLAGLLFVGLGAFVGGSIIRLLNVNSRFMSKWIATSALLYVLGMLALMNLGCPENKIIHFSSESYLSTDCLTNCNCLQDSYDPICSNGTTYLSPCLAGCKSHRKMNGRIIYDDCSCGVRESHDKLSRPMEPASQGHCSPGCDNLKWYIIVFSITTFVHASCEVGAMMLNLRCVKPSERTMSLGMITFASSLFGTIPCSIIYGTIIDLTCIHWDAIIPHQLSSALASPEPLKGACLAYENESFSFYLHGTTALVMFLAFIVDCVIVGRANEVDFYDQNHLRSSHEVKRKVLGVESSGEIRNDMVVELRGSTETI